MVALALMMKTYFFAQLFDATGEKVIANWVAQKRGVNLTVENFDGNSYYLCEKCGSI